MPKEFNYTWTWDLQSSPEALWPLVSDTNRFNHDTGLPPMILLGTSKGVKRIKLDVPVVNVEWEEEPFEWIYPYHFGILRRYKTGPFKEMRVDCHMERAENSGTRLIYKVRMQSRNILGDVVTPLVIGVVSAKRFGEAFKKYDQIIADKEQAFGTQASKHFSSASRNNLKNKIARLKEQNIDGVSLDRLTEFLERADDISVQQMRPYTLADGWGLPRRAVLEVFLRATRAGIIDMYWDVLCPECRGVTDDFANLNELHGASHCGACQMDFNAHFDENIEVIFRPNESVRKVDAKVQFCVGTSPQRQPRVILNNLVVPAREEMSVGVMFNEGRYNVYAAELDGAQILSATNKGADEVAIYARATDLPNEIVNVGFTPRLKLINETDQNQTFSIVSADWVDQAATAADVTTLQVFRDLFSSEVFRPGEEISIGSATLMFTDLRGSTKLYREIGDAQAFSRVREHFEILERAVAAEGGSIVKTMGDAIMAAFRSPENAIRAIWDVQKELTSRGQPLLMIKVGIHQGPCIAVNLNDRLDYFGSTVNITSRLPGFSTGGEVVFSQAIHDDPEALAFLERNAQPNSITKFMGDIRGYDQPMDLWKVKMG
jgi:class 3 adenylate cyclase